MSLEKRIIEFNESFKAVENEIGKVIVGNQDIVRHTLTAFFAGGHVLLEGVPGLGKTLLVKTIASTLGLSFKRIQFTPDLMPSDLTGTDVVGEDKVFAFKQGPLFANIVLADEINRATPKTQSALLEAMEEKQITVLGKTHILKLPFFVLATQNPIELEGTYPLPEAQLDRFICKVLVKSPGSVDLKEILTRTTKNTVVTANSIFNENAHEKISDLKKTVRDVEITDTLLEVLTRMILALNPNSEYSTKKSKAYLTFGSGPRGAQAVLLSAKVNALLAGRPHVALEDIRTALKPCLRHRLILNFSANAEGITADDLIQEVESAK